jgi:hypothetical protein
MSGTGRMTTTRQWHANRRNARKSTGPRTLNGKMRSRQNAIRHGLAAETVVGVLENLEDYRAFEAAIIADFDPRTSTEHELVARLASLLWRLRRAVAIESGIMNIQGMILHDCRTQPAPSQSTEHELPDCHSDFGIDALRPDIRQPNGRPQSGPAHMESEMAKIFLRTSLLTRCDFNI